MDRVIPNSPPSSSSSEEEGNVEERRAPDPAHTTTTASNDMSRQENPSSTAPRDNAAPSVAKQPSSKSRQMGSKKQASAKKGSMLPPSAPVPQPGSGTRRIPVQESPAGPSSERNSTQQQTNGSSTSGTGTRQPPTNHSQTSQHHVNEPQQNQPPPNNTVPIAEESQVINASSFIFYRHDDGGFRAWTPTANVFQMTLSELIQDLGWRGNNVQPLYMTLDTPYEPWANNVEPGNNDQFNGVIRSFVKKMQRCYQRARKPNLEFELHFSQQPV